MPEDSFLNERTFFTKYCNGIFVSTCISKSSRKNSKGPLHEKFSLKTSLRISETYTDYERSENLKKCMT